MIETTKTASMINIEDPSFIATKQYRKFAEFCDACKKTAYIGLCYGPPGVGKTYAATHYTHWDFVERWREQFDEYLAPHEVRAYDAVLVTPGVAETPKEESIKKRGAYAA